MKSASWRIPPAARWAGADRRLQLPNGLATSAGPGTFAKTLTLIPHHRERQIMQLLHGRGWVKASHLPQRQGLLSAYSRSGGLKAKAQGRI